MKINSFLIIALILGVLGSSYPAPKPVQAQSADPVFVGAGDIANCGNTQDEATAKLLDGIPGTVFTLGDNVYPDGTLTQFNDCYGPTWGRHKARTRPAVGNHDYHTAGAAGYYSYFGSAASPQDSNCTSNCKGYYSYNLGAWHIIALNGEIDHTVGSAQEKWLRADLAANPSMCTLAYWHEPRFSSGMHGNNSGMQPFWQALYDYGADVILNGHDHTYQRFAPQNPSAQAEPTRGIREFVAGTGGAGLYAFTTNQPNTEVRNNTTFGVLKLTLHATSYNWQFIPIAGQTFTDSGSANCVSASGQTPPTATRTPTSKPTATATSTSTLAPSPTTMSTTLTLNPTTTQASGATSTALGSSTSTPATLIPSATTTQVPGVTPTATLPPIVQPGPSDLIFTDGFESGNLSAWSSSTTDGGDLSVNTAAALSGSNGLQTLIDDNNPIYVTDDNPAAEQHYRVRFYFDPNSIKMASDDAFAIFNGFTGTSPEVLRVGFIFSSGKYQLRGRLLNDSGTWLNTSWFTISDAPHIIELDWRAATAKGMNDGGLTLWIDGTQQANLTKVDNDTRRIDRVRLGAVAGIDSGTRGICYFDAFESRKQTFIGAATGSTDPIPATPLPYRCCLSTAIQASPTSSLLSATPTSTVIQTSPTSPTPTPIAWAEDAMSWVYKNDPAKTNSSISLYSAKNEYEPFQIVVRAPSANSLSNVSVSVSDLMGPNGSIISSNNINLYREHYIYITQGSTHHTSETNKPLGPGWYPDALIPFKNPDTGQDLIGTLDAVPFNVAINQNQPIWVDIYTPANTSAGTYQGTATITSAQGNTTINIILNVWNFSLPKGKALNGSMMTWNYKNTKTDTEILEHGSNPKHVIRTDERPFMDIYGMRELAVFKESGANRNNCTEYPAPSVSEVAAEVTKHQAGLYLYDSYANEVWTCTNLTSMFLAWAKNLRAGGIHPMIVTYPTDALMGPDINNTAADIWSILPKHFDGAKANIDKLINHQGTEIWSYNPLVQDGYSPKFTVDFLPINFRIMQGFINQSMGLRGTKFWRIDYWSSDPWNNVEPARADTPGDGLMAYRGDDVGLPGQIVPGFRMKLYREGSEDFEYVEILKKMGQGEFAINTIRSVATDFHIWSKDKNALYAARKILGDKIQSLSGVTPTP